MTGSNIDAGIFMSYVGLFSYYQFDNWAYQPSYVSSNTPWFFNGVRIQIFPSDKLKIEPWIVNGWQSYGMFNSAPGFGVQVLWRPDGSLSVLSNNYYGTDWLGSPGFRLPNRHIVGGFDEKTTFNPTPTDNISCCGGKSSRKRLSPSGDRAGNLISRSGRR